MPRNGSGTYTLPTGNPVSPGTTIESAWANTTLSDIGTELTNSLSRTGAGGMLGPFRLADGTLAAPGVAFLNETGTGLYRAGSGEMWAAVQGIQIQQFTTNGVLIPTGKTFTAQGDSTFAANVTLGDASTDTVTVNGYMGVGGAGNSGYGINVASTALTGSSQYGIVSGATFTSAATANATAIAAAPATAASGATHVQVHGLRAFNPAKGAGSTITNAHGVYIDDLTSGTNNYGITSTVSSGANKWNIYASGTAQNYFAGNVGIGTAMPGVLLDVLSSSAQARVTGFGSASVDTRLIAANTGNGGAGRGVAVSLQPCGSANSVEAVRLVGLQESVSATANNASFAVQVANTSGTLIERMRIDSAGNVGIGTSSPNRGNYIPSAAICTTESAVGGVFEVSSTQALTNGKTLGVIGFANQAASSGKGSAFILGLQDGTNAASPGGALTFSTRPDGGSATERLRIDSAGNLQVQAGAVVVYAPAPAAISTTATLTNANIQAQIINTTGTTYTVTMPLGTTMETLCTWSATNLGYDFSVINTASGTITMAANTGVTTLGGLTIATGTSASFRIRRTAANTFIMYRLS